MNITTNGHPKKAKDITSALDDGAGAARVMGKFYPILIAQAWRDASDLGISFDLENEHVQTVLGKLAKQIKGVAETTKDEVRRLVGLQAENGWSIDELKEQIIAHGVTASKSRATTIARTETAAAYSQGSIAAYRESGVVSHLEWLTADDDLTCDICAPLSGKRVKLDSDFADGIGFPPAHPDCRCAISPVVSD